MLSIPWVAGLVVVVLLFTLIQFGAISIAFGKLGLSAGSAGLLLLSSLIGSAVNLPLLALRGRSEDADLIPEPEFPDFTLPPYTGKTTLAINIGGGLIPAAFSGYLVLHQDLPLRELGLGILLISLICYLLSRPVRRISVGLPALVAPLVAALFAVFATPDHSASTAYICGTLGMLIGTDLMGLPSLARQRIPRASIGGAGTFDGVFVTGIVAALLA